MTTATVPLLSIAPAQVVRGDRILVAQGGAMAALGQRPLVVGGRNTLKRVQPLLSALEQQGLVPRAVSYGADCSEASLNRLRQLSDAHRADVVIGVGGGKALDTAKLLAYQIGSPVVTVPTSGATCAAWTALSNVYSDEGAFRYDVTLPRCPDLLVLDYDLIRTSSPRTLIAGIGDGLAKWYEAAVSSGTSEQTLIISAVQQARVLRDILFQKSARALADWGGSEWKEVVDATVLLAGVIGGVGGAQCRTVAAHAVHNGLTQLTASHGTLHGEKVAYGILVQLRLEEMGPKGSLATTARQQLIQFYRAIGLPMTLQDLGLADMPLSALQQAAMFACREGSDIHHLPFTLSPDGLMAAMVSTLCPELREREGQSAATGSTAASASVSPSQR